MKLTIGPSYTTVQHTIPEMNWLSSILQVPYLTWRGREARQSFITYLPTTFPTGLLAYVADEATKAGVPVEYGWLPESYRLPVVRELPGTFPNGKSVRSYQEEAVRAAAQQGRGIVELATGSGKTAIMAMLIWLLGVPKTLVLVGTRTLVKQNRREISEWLGEEVGEWSGRRKITDPNVVVGIVASLQRYDEFVSSRRLLLLDEVHHASADTWYRISMACPGSGRFGFSATAIKPGEAVKNWKLVSATGPRIPVRVTASDLIEQGYGARPYIYYWKFKAPRVPRSAGYPTAITDALVHCTPRNTCIVDSCNQLVRSGLKTLVLIERLDHLQVLLAGIRGAGIPCRGISGKMDGLTQEKALDWFRADSPRVLVATRVVGEGVNIPSIRAVVWAAAGQSYTKVLQAIGRAMRPTGDNTCIIVDFQDDHNPYLKQQYKRRRLAVSAERAFLVGTDGLGFDEFLQEVLSE